jgi:hypothetical protein
LYGFKWLTATHGLLHGEFQALLNGLPHVPKDETAAADCRTALSLDPRRRHQLRDGFEFPEPFWRHLHAIFILKHDEKSESHH